MQILGEERKVYPSDHGYEILTLIVLVSFESDEQIEAGNYLYAAYVGHGSPQWVARHGNKLTFRQAAGHFPIGLDETRYRQ